jgi:hypothetical protein
MIEQVVPSALKGGAAVEFDDGCHALDVIDAALPDDLGECLDLTVCESVLLGEVLRRRRNRSVILTNVETTSPDFRMALYRQAIRLVRRRATSYPEAMMALRAHLRRQVWT